MPGLTSQAERASLPDPEGLEPAWKKSLRLVVGVSLVLFVSAFLAFAYFLCFLLVTGSPVRTATQSVMLHPYGTVYVTPTEQRGLDWLRWFLIIGGLSFFATAFLIQNVFGVTLRGPVSLPLSTETVAWKKAVRRVLCYVLIFLLGVAAFSFCYFSILMLTGSEAPTSLANEALVSHGHVVYVTLFEKRLLNWLWLLFGAGMPALGVAAVFSHFALGVKIFSRTALE